MTVVFLVWQEFGGPFFRKAASQDIKRLNHPSIFGPTAIVSVAMPADSRREKIFDFVR